MTDLILGYGKSGRAAHAFLQRLNRKILIWDDKASKPKLSWEDVERVVLSPGIAPEHPVLQEAKKRKKTILGEMELGVRYTKNPCIGVTGTNGKTSVTKMITHVLNASKIKAVALGNIGTPLTDYLLNPDPEETLVLELSSFQLETMKTPIFDRAVFLNLSPDHLDRYKDFEAYKRAKCRIAKILKQEGIFFIFERDSLLFEESPRQRIIASFADSGYAEHGENESAVFSICNSLGVGRESFLKALSSFEKPAHRLEKIKEVKGISFYNDSKATNKDSVRFALAQIPFVRVFLLAGGIDKGGSWKGVLNQKVEGIFAFGSSADQIEQELNSEFKVKKVQSLKEALNEAYAMAQRGDCILLSPGCSSFDQFDHYEHRGDVFKSLVEELK